MQNSLEHSVQPREKSLLLLWDLRGLVSARWCNLPSNVHELIKSRCQHLYKAVFIYVQQNTPCEEENDARVNEISSSGAVCDVTFACRNMPGVNRTEHSLASLHESHRADMRGHAITVTLSRRTWADSNTHMCVCCRWSWWSAHPATFALPSCFAVWLMRGKVVRLAVLLVAICFYHQKEGGGLKVQRKHVHLLYTQGFRLKRLWWRFGLFSSRNHPVQSSFRNNKFCSRDHQTRKTADRDF